MNPYVMAGTVITSKDITIHPHAHLIIGGYAMQESGEIVEVKSLAHIEVLTDMGAKLVTVKQSALDTVGKQLKKSFRPMVNLESSFENFKRAVIFNK